LPAPEQTTQWIEVLIAAPPPQAEAVADFLVTLTGRGVETSDESDWPGLAQVRGFMTAGADTPAQRAALERFVEGLRAMGGEGGQDDGEGGGVVRLDYRDLADQDWGQNWKKHFKPRALTPGLVVAPPWEPAAPEPGQTIIIIDPGQAFGTGQHESTLLCLKRVERMAGRDLLPDSMLDVGCGTGILALAYLLLGGAWALAVDIDPLAVEAARHNAALNGVAERITVSDRPLAEVQGRFGLITANLTAPDLKALAPQLAPLLQPGGELVAAGLLSSQVEEVRRAFADQGLAVLEQDFLAGWASLVLG
jgi:ribosomal protein L11 methyltransferase